MTTMTTEQIRDRFRELALEARRQIREGSSEAANAATTEAEALVQPAIEGGRLFQLLQPLLHESEKDWVRYSAASTLLGNSEPEFSVPVLEDLQANGKGLAAAGAESVLRMWRKKQQQS